MAERGRKAALEKMTYDRLMKKMLDEISERLEESKYGR
jgi:tRNA G10  N-methylase Trm11